MKSYHWNVPTSGAVIKAGLLTVIFTLTANYSHANIETIIHDISRTEKYDLEAAQQIASQLAAGNGDGLGHHSTSLEEIRTFSGSYTPPELPEDKAGQYVYGLAIFSDDGCDVSIDGKNVHSRHNKGQALPNLSQSFHPLKTTLTPGVAAEIKVDYSNTQYTPKPSAPDIDGCTLFVYLIRITPFKIVELAPKVTDENGNQVAGSEKPNEGLPLTPFVEEDPYNNRIAHREIKVKFDEAYKGKKVTWSLEALPGATPATIRGKWSDSETHNKRFEKSAAYGEYSYKDAPQEQGTTLIADDGHTAVRVNIPPIGFNQARIKIQLEGIELPFELIDMEVPAVVVIDPGHGGDGDKDGSSDNNATANPSEILEKEMTLDYGLALRDSLIQRKKADKINIKILMTRDTDDNLTGAERAIVARSNGADVFVSIHFNAANKSARGTESLVRDVGNVNETEDRALGRRVLDGVLAAIKHYDKLGVKDRGVKDYEWSEKLQKNIPSQWAVLSDTSYGNQASYHPIRGIISEIEFIDVPAVDALLNTNSNADKVKSSIVNEIRNYILEDLIKQPVTL